MFISDEAELFLMHILLIYEEIYLFLDRCIDK
jgi:hypothetical protein